MGNHLSCVSPLPHNTDEPLPPSASELLRPSLNAAPDLPENLIFLDCETATFSKLQGPLTAAEAMLEFPGQFLSLVPDLDSYCVGACGPRISAVPADKELQSSQIYLLLHMKRLNSRFCLREMDFFKSLKATQRSTAKQAFSGRLPGSKVAPLPDDGCIVTSVEAYAELVIQLKASSFNGIRDVTASPDPAYVHNQPLQGPSLRRTRTWIPGLETVDESNGHR
ncbi:hypothetical protein KP509_14G097100 [Ceratopteris richardii]|uniref:Uncharacterized protein n=1 Tax=Ceratopteris richardii TaxID=49495 RepID=A0A8T2TAL2_CERRI|nr:hypothetical protein KP509_14G097100 [Ceratopteris richardii]